MDPSILIPRFPDDTYKGKGWKGWNDLFGTESHIIKNPPTYEEYKKWAQTLGVTSGNQFKALDKSKFPKKSKIIDRC